MWSVLFLVYLFFIVYWFISFPNHVKIYFSVDGVYGDHNGCDDDDEDDDDVRVLFPRSLVLWAIEMILLF